MTAERSPKDHRKALERWYLTRIYTKKDLLKDLYFAVDSLRTTSIGNIYLFCNSSVFSLFIKLSNKSQAVFASAGVFCLIVESDG